MAKPTNKLPILWASTGVFFLGLIFARFVFPELVWLSITLGVLLVATLVGLVRAHQVSLKSRSVAYGLNSAITVLLILGIVGVLNFMSARYPKQLDLTKTKLHTLSDQTVKLVKGLQKPVKAIYFQKPGDREKIKALLDQYRALNPKFETEFVDPAREPTRVKQAGIRKYGTLQLLSGEKDSKIDDVSEEKLTNALIKLLKEKNQTVCAVKGHGEISLTSTAADGFDLVRQSIANQSYETKEISLVQDGKIPAECSVIMILGPNKSFFEPEIKLINDYLANGGRMVLALDLAIQKGESTREIAGVLENWGVKATEGLVIDPTSKMFGSEAAVPIVAAYSKDSPITRDFQVESYFPTTRAIEILPTPPAGATVQWLGQTTPNSLLITDLAQIKTGQVKLDSKNNKPKQYNVGVAIESKKTRIVVFGTSKFANNQFSRAGGNLDFFVNAVTWTLEDESLISIRAKEEGSGKIELSQKQGTFIFLLTVIAIPLLIAAGGVVIWALRRRL